MRCVAKSVAATTNGYRTSWVGDTLFGTREATGRLVGEGASSFAWVDDGVVPGIREHPGLGVDHRMTLGNGRFFLSFSFLLCLDHPLLGRFN